MKRVWPSVHILPWNLLASSLALVACEQIDVGFLLEELLI